MRIGLERWEQILTHHYHSAYYHEDTKISRRNPAKKVTLNRVIMSRDLKLRRGRYLRAPGLTDSEILEIMLDRMLPPTRGDCPDKRPCAHVSCVYHLKYDDGQEGALIENHKKFTWDEIDQTCALDMADSGETTLGTIGELMGLTRERVRQIEQEALKKLAANNDAADLFLMLGGKR